MLYDIATTQFSKMLQNLSVCLDKGAAYAESKKVPFDVLLQSRLAPDQFALVRQIQITCDTAKLGASRLSGKDAPNHPDTETTLAELQARITSVVDYLGTLKPADFNEASTRHITQPRWEGQYLTGEEYALQHMMPNFYFHLTTAYAILRHNGVDVGKKNYLGALPLKR